jgi:hypothetical protein
MIMMLGMTGYITLQSEYVVADTNLNLRNIALQLAQDKLNDLNYFQRLGNANGLPAYTDIMTNQGGSIAAGESQVQLSSNLLNTHIFETNWQVTDLYYVDTDKDKVADSWVKIGDKFFPNVTPQHSDIKSVAVNLIWLDQHRQLKQLTLLGNIVPIAQSPSFQTKYRIKSVFASP